ncbi:MULTISPECIES: hypothetical protein [Niastella]|uniref:DUF1877 family protein n=1 Tax=Niastella soli TaxID=2821487 RepID=A0ABS3YZU2_9BACT|nr:hypothetical protein [Niastella soli]MBO9203349.1 hypothetical protein [Niastella soli]
MSMDYSIQANVDTDCDDFFPELLSNFLEQITITEYNSEVKQVSEILNINLDAFLMYWEGDSDTEDKYWQDIDTFASLIDNFIIKISENKDYYRKVRYNSHNRDSLSDQLHELLHSNDEQSLTNVLSTLYSTPGLDLPFDRGYLSSNQILDDLNDLQSILNCYKEAGATKIRLLYG